MSERLFRLTRMHSSLDTAITRESQLLRPDMWRLLRLKKLRLAVKDQLARAAAMLRRV